MAITIRGLPEHCDMEGLLRVTPLAPVALVAVCIDILGLAAMFPARLLRAVLCYVTGMIVVDRSATAARVADYFGGMSHDQLTRMLGQEKWNCSMLMLRMIRLIQRLGAKGVLILDDTLLQHPRSRKMQGVYWDWDHAEQRYVFGQRLVMLIWSDGFWRIPVAFAFWHKKGARPKYKTKNEIARTLLQWAVSRGVRPAYVAFDNWYASKRNLRLIVGEMSLQFVTRLKKNAYVHWESKRIRANVLGQRLLTETRPYRIRSSGT